MKKIAMAAAALLTTLVMNAADTYTVTVTYSGTQATVSIPSAVSSYVSCSSGTSSHVVLKQTSTTASNPGEIVYTLSGSSTNGSFYMTGEYKATLQLSGLTLANPDSAAIRIHDGKRIKISLKNGTTNTLSDGANDTANGCIHCKGHTEFKGKGTLNISGSSKHAIYSKEYVEVANCTINVTSAKKDGIHCQEYFLMESGSVTISNASDDGIQVEIKDSDNATGQTTDHEDEDSGNFYQTGGTLTISNFGGKAIKADGTISNSGGTWSGFTSSDNTQNAASGIASITFAEGDGSTAVYDLNGRRMDANALTLPKGIYIIRQGNKTTKTIIQ